MSSESAPKPTVKHLEANGLHLCVEDYGPADAPPVVMIMGLGAQLTLWPMSLVQGLMGRGYRVIRFDNRDIGLSDEVKSTRRFNTQLSFAAFRLGRRPASVYTLHDMAADTVGLLDALGLKSAHLVGASMGGMIAQIVAATHPQRVRSLTLAMTTSNDPSLPMPELHLLWKLSRRDSKAKDDEVLIQRWLKLWRSLQSPKYPTPINEVEARIRAGFKRSYRPGGIVRQMQAILATGSLRPLLHKIHMPSLVIHGNRDPLVRLAAGQALAHDIPSAHLEVIDGLGHDLPQAMMPRFAELIDLTAKRAQGGC